MEAAVSSKPPKCHISKDVISCNLFSGAIAKLQNRLLASSCLSVHPHETRLPLDGLSWNLIFGYFFSGKLLRTLKFHYKLTGIADNLHEGQYTFLIIFRSDLLRMTKVVEKFKTHVICWIAFFLKTCRLWGNVKKHWRAGHATNDDMAHALCMRDT
jgi:hypothetical protein